MDNFHVVRTSASVKSHGGSACWRTALEHIGLAAPTLLKATAAAALIVVVQHVVDSAVVVQTCAA
eukprot:3275549-Prorocentrum_lima.AAC.1